MTATTDEARRGHSQDARDTEIVVSDHKARVCEHHRQGNLDQGIVLGEAHQCGIESGGDHADAEASEGHPHEAHGPMSKERRAASIRDDCGENTSK